MLVTPSVFSLTRLLDTLDNAASVWTDVKSQAPIKQQNLVPLTKLWSQKTEEEIETYQSVVTNQVRFAMQYVMGVACILRSWILRKCGFLTIRLPTSKASFRSKFPVQGEEDIYIYILSVHTCRNGSSVPACRGTARSCSRTSL